MKPGLTPGTMPRTKPGDHERALALLAATADSKATKKHLTELKDATAIYDNARDDAQAAEHNAAERDIAAQASEGKAIRARQTLADETAAARSELGQRETAVAERERLATECETSQEARDKELTRREDHLKKAGVRGF